ncbi:MAG: iron ABC transporter permease [Deltaproteobacteria bacterium]|nr:iron ABC transporter permease [Deltaproteobacteria bacterium]
MAFFNGLVMSESAAQRRWRPSLPLDKLIFVLPAAAVTYLVVPPLALLLISTFRSTADRLPFEPGPWILSNYATVFTSSETYFLFQNSLLYALCTVLSALTIAVVLVWLIERTDLPGRNLLFTLVLIPLAIPGLIKAIGWSLLASPRIGAVNVALRNLLGTSGDLGPLNIYSLPGIIFVSTLSNVPPMALMISGSFRSFDPALEEASEASGASRSQTQRLVTLPLLRPALYAAFIYYLADLLDDFQIPAVLGLNAGVRVLSTKIFLATRPVSGLPDYGLASGYAMVLFSVAMVLILLYRRMERTHHRFAVITGKGYRPRRIHLGAGKHVALAGIGLYLLLAAILPVLILLWTSLQPFFTVPSAEGVGRLTLANYRGLWGMSQFKQAALNTGLVALIVASATMLLSTLTAWMAQRGRFWGSSVPDTLTFVNTAVPSVVFGLAVMFVYLSFPVLPIYGTVWILVIAFTTRYLTYSTRLMGGAVVQIHQELEEASHTSGASSWTTFRRITLPLLFPSFLNGWLWVAVHALREATIAVMLMTPANVVLGALIWERFQEGGEHGPVAAMSILVMAASFLLTFIGRKTLLREPTY